MVEVDKDFASKGVAGAGLGLGIAGTALGLLNGGGLPGLLGGWNNGAAMCHENMPVNRYELAMQKDLTNKDMEIAYLKGRDAAKTDSLELYRYIDGRFTGIERELADQRVYNSTNTAALGCMQGQIAQLMSLTKIVVPAANICPQPMAMYNSWTAPTTTTGA